MELIEILKERIRAEFFTNNIFIQDTLVTIQHILEDVIRKTYEELNCKVYYCRDDNGIEKMDDGNSLGDRYYFLVEYNGNEVEIFPSGILISECGEFIKFDTNGNDIMCRIPNLSTKERIKMIDYFYEKIVEEDILSALMHEIESDTKDK